MKRQWRLFWILSLLLLWLFCSGTAAAGVLSDRLSQFPDWHEKALAQPAKDEDLFYPDWFDGNWSVTTTLVDMVAPLAPDVVTPGFEGNRQFLNQPITFPIRFVKLAAPRIQSLLSPILRNKPPQVVSDRAFNGESLTKAYLGDQSILAVKIDPTNPNRQITLFRSDRQLVSTVIARATEAPDPDRFITTEVFQQEFLGAPEIYFNEVENTTAYTHHSTLDSPESPEIVADQVTAIYLSPQDPQYFDAIDPKSLFGEPRPVALYRYRMEFYRKDEG
jgi:hypothetical protein